MAMMRRGGLAIVPPLARLTGRCVQASVKADEWMRNVSYNLHYEGRDSDIFIVSYPKSGTTWLQMVLYQLMTDGNMEIPHIRTFSPFLERRLIPANLAIQDWPEPHVIKTHLPYARVPKGPGRYVYVARNGLDVAVSLYHHSRRFGLGPNEPFNSFFSQFLAGKTWAGSWFTHVNEWAQNRASVRVLWLTYEELSSDLQASVRRIAAFCGLGLDEAALPRILERSSFAFMRQHERRFDPGQWEGGSMNLDAEDDHFIRRGQSGGWRTVMSEDMLTAFRERLAQCGGQRELQPYLTAVQTSRESQLTGGQAS